jgi:hypothetical protein
MPRAVDHLVIAARDLEAQAALYRRLGFQVGARNRHPWGTENHIVQFDGAFLELIGLGESFVAPTPSEDVFPFSGFVASYLERREGIAMLVLRSADAKADWRRFKAEEIGDFARFDFARKGRRPDGREVEVAFSLAFAASPALPETGFFVCQQHFPENFWSRAAQVHPNGALGIAGLTIVCERPGDAAEFLGTFLDAPDRRIPGGSTFHAAGATIECVTPSAFSARYAAPSPREGVVAVRVCVPDLAVAEAVLKRNGATFRHCGGETVVDAPDAMGALIAFVEATPARLA